MNFLEKQLTEPASLARIKRSFYVALGVIALAEIVLPRFFHADEVHFSFENFPAWGSIYGLISCVAIILLSKLIGKALLIRREDYYDS
jgi:hypothetical protein